MEYYKVGDNVCKGELKGTIWKITDEAIHVRYDDPEMFEKFHFNPTHHMQTNICELSKVTN